jgi:hypothetical protein
MVTSAQLKEMSFDDALDLPINMMEDAKPFQQLPEGVYIFRVVKAHIGVIGSGDNQKPAGIIDLIVVATKELSKTLDEKGEPIVAPAEGTEFQISLATAKSLQFFKTTWAAPLTAAGLAEASNREILTSDKLINVEVVGVISHYSYKDKETKEPRTGVRLDNIALA